MAKTTPKTTQPTPTADGVTATYHPQYTLFKDDWTLLAHVREGLGGFKDGTYLVAHPREWKDFAAEIPMLPTKKLLARRTLACYENVASTIMEAKKSALFREVPTRQVGEAQENREPTPLERWWQNVDGAGTAVDDFMPYAWDIAGSISHVWLYMDRPKGLPGTTAADTALPFVRVYTPLDVIDWLTNDQGQVTSLLFREPVPRTAYTQASQAQQFRLRLVNETFWALYDQGGQLLEGGPVDGLHRMGGLPAVQLFGRRRALFRHVGQAVLNEPKLYVDLYNLTSEVRELLRNQTFSFINIPLGTGDQATDVEKAKAMLGTEIGAMNVIFSATAAQILSGEAANVTVYHAEFERRLRTIYRLTGVSWEADSRAAEAQGSLKLKREDMNTRLSTYADELEKAEYALAKLFYRAMDGEHGDARLLETTVRIRYPDQFDLTPFDVVLEQAQAIMALNFPALVLKEIRKALLPKFLPDLDTKTLKELEQAIDQAEDDPTALAKIRTRVAGLMGAPKDGTPPKDGAQVPPVAA